ncbi:hypothetical protein HG535_0G00950 [Zygotorulaspora mrakii]|uniref:Stress response protein NST1 n=1 Tax=Zygotorulaspora mrakii TaxID=42260 RepID=A0A7H9B6B6_ZYGMR|nr:uncharacterized protein HG535_0G00950 [Zygotorulaspora mrakii]QLG74211.1 hypothetical protein HG535_0G00950 [Zygotorulaspora mrakii]
MPPNSKKGKKRSKSKQHTKKALSGSAQVPDGGSLEAQVYDEEGEYPTSRVIKRAPNGDVIVESIPEKHDKRRASHEQLNSTAVTRTQPSISAILDSHWESLSSDDKKNILRIEKNEIFEVLRDYQVTHSCTCSVCGRRHMSMEIEMERIYEMLYEMDKVKDPELNPVKFHLSIIKELQNFKMRQTGNEFREDELRTDVEKTIGEKETANELENMRDDVVKYFLSSDAVDTLKEEVNNFKQYKQQLLHNGDHLNGNNHNASTSTSQNRSENNTRSVEENSSKVLTNNEPILSSSTTEDNIENDLSNDKSENTSSEHLQEKYIKFAKTFVSSHPKIAEEYVNRMMMYPDMQELTDDLMNNNGQEFVKAIEEFVMEKEDCEPEMSSLERPHQPESRQNEFDLSKIQHRDEVEGYTAIKHNGKVLTPEEYNMLQRMIADSIVDSYDKTTDQFNEISPIERELFTRFIYGEDKKEFRHILGQTYNDRILDHDPYIDTCLAAAAATTATPKMIRGNDSQIFAYKHDSKHAGNNNFNDTYDEYSEYEHEDDELEYDDDEDDDEDDYEDEDEDGVESDLVDQEEVEARYDDDEHCINSYPNIKEAYHNQHSSQYNHSNELEEEYDEEEYDEEDQYDSGVDEAGRIEEGRKLIQISITKLLQARIMDSYHEKQAETNRLKLLQELEAEEQKKKAKEEKKQKKKEKEKEKKKAHQLAKEEENRRKEQEAEEQKKEAEERERQRREAQRQKVEEVKRKRDEERKRKLEEQRRREEEQERQRKLKEEQKRKRDEERKMKEEEKRKREESKRLKEQQREMQELQRKNAEEQKNSQASRKKSEQDAITNMERMMPSPMASQFSSISPNMPYGNVGQPLPDVNSSNINDEINSIINSASVSQTTLTSPSHLNGLLHPSHGTRNNLSPNQHMMSDANRRFDTSGTLQSSSFTADSIGLDPLSCLHPNASSSQDLGNSMKQQSFGLPSWNSFTTKPTTAPEFQHIQHAHRNSQVHLHENGSSAFDLDGSEITNSHFFEEEIDNLTNILKSAALNEVPTKDNGTSDQSLLWGNQRASTGVTTPNNESFLNRDGGHLSGISMPGLENPNPRDLRNSSQHSSIWGSLNNGSSISGNQGEVLSLSKDLDPAAPTYSSSNIWNNSMSNGMSFLNGSNAVSHSSAHQTPNPLKSGMRLPVQNTISEDDMQESIYKVYLAFSSAHTNEYVPTDLLHQNSLCRSIDYSTFITFLLRMRISHGCDFLADSSGSITHIRISTPPAAVGHNNRMGSISHENLPADLYAGQPHRQLDQHASSSGINSNLNSNSRLFSTISNLNPSSSITGSFWS